MTGPSSPLFNNSERSPSAKEARQFPYILNRRWEVVDELGQGGMGTVYMARDLNLTNLSQQKKSCVVKRLKDQYFREEDKEKAQEFFLREVCVLADLDHPNIVRVLDQFCENGIYYLVMEYVQGQNLHEMLMKRQEPFQEKEVIDWAVQICDVLTYLHTHNPPVIYRDLKPSNIMINSIHQVKLVDFGIARPFEDTEDNTQVVSQGYSPPEQYWGAADPRSDVYALGATMHFLLTGKDPLALQVSSPKAINPNISSHVDAIVSRATQQEVQMRFQSAREMKEELLYRPAAEKPKKGSALYVVAVCIGALIAFMGGLQILGQLIEETSKETQQASLLKEEETDPNENKQAPRKKERDSNDKYEKTAREAQIGFDEPPAQTEPDASALVSSQKCMEELDERALTDPAGLGPAARSALDR